MERCIYSSMVLKNIYYISIVSQILQERQRKWIKQGLRTVKRERATEMNKIMRRMQETDRAAKLGSRRGQGRQGEKASRRRWPLNWVLKGKSGITGFGIKEAFYARVMKTVLVGLGQKRRQGRYLGVRTRSRARVGKLLWDKSSPLITLFVPWWPTLGCWRPNMHFLL